MTRSIHLSYHSYGSNNNTSLSFNITLLQRFNNKLENILCTLKTMPQTHITDKWIPSLMHLEWWGRNIWIEYSLAVLVAAGEVEWSFGLNKVCLYSGTLQNSQYTNFYAFWTCLHRTLLHILSDKHSHPKKLFWVFLSKVNIIFLLFYWKLL